MNKQKARADRLDLFTFRFERGYLVLVYRKPCIFSKWLFVVGLSYLSNKGWIDVKWMEMENVTRSTLIKLAGQAVHALNNSASQFAAHLTTVEAAGLPVAAAFGFMPGIMFGLKRE